MFFLINNQASDRFNFGLICPLKVEFVPRNAALNDRGDFSLLIAGVHVCPID